MKKLTDEQKTQALAIAGFYDPTWVGDTADLYSLMDALNGLTAEAAEQREQGQAVAWPQYKVVVDALSNLLGQVEKFCIEHGEADFSTGEALRAMESVCEYEAKSTPPAGVPDEATPAMLEAYGRVLAMGSELDGAMVWRAMLSAAPQPAAQTQEREAGT